MTKCKHWDCGWCCAPTDVKTNALGSGVCNLPECCPYLKSQNQMTDMIFSTDGEEKFRIPFPIPEIITPTHKLEIKKMTITADEFFGKDLKVYDTKMTETIQQLKEDIAILQEKLQKLEELQRTKSPAEEAYKGVYGWYPPTTPNVSNYEDNRWSAFQNGYNASKEECKVEEEPKPTPETLYQMFNDEKWSKCGCDHICKVVEEWMSQYTCETNKWDEDYKCGFLDCLDVLRKNLK